MKWNFKLAFPDTSGQWIDVVVFETIKRMKHALRMCGDKRYKVAAACCHIPHKTRRDKMVARIFLNCDRLSVETIVHESTHAARARQRINHRKINEEQLAEDTGRISEAIIACLWEKQKGIVKVHYPRKVMAEKQ